MPNRLASETSPYLLQHQNNPVDWYPWGDEAFEAARKRGIPIFLSIGYSSCHWCHVMEHEVFENEVAAELMNREFVSIKVDREERPDVDEVYMAAVQLLMGSGGWPLSAWLTPDLKPIFAGTYFPLQDRGNYPGFLTICQRLSTAWATDREKLLDAADQLQRGIEQVLTRRADTVGEVLTWVGLSSVLETLYGDWDGKFGGFGTAPKFPPYSALELALDVHEVLQVPSSVKAESLQFLEKTLSEMALGGIHDQVGGGFHRYSTDRQWHLPHFEKMLYDNAALLSCYGRAAASGLFDFQTTRYFQEVAEGIVRWLDREMYSPEGLYYSALDADSEGEEGKFYVWKAYEIREALGERAEPFIEAYGVADAGNFRDEATQMVTGENVLHRASVEAGSFQKELAELLALRSQRVRPETDVKCLIAWNALLVVGFANAGFVEHSTDLEERMWGLYSELGYLPHQVVGGSSKGEAFLDGYGGMAYAESVLAEVTGENRYRYRAMGLIEECQSRFEVSGDGVFRFSTTDQGFGYSSSVPVFDQPTPSANGMVFLALLGVGDLEAAERGLLTLSGWMQAIPTSCETLLRAALSWLSEGGESTAPKVRVEVVEKQVYGERLVVSLRVAVPDGWHAKPIEGGNFFTAGGAEIRVSPTVEELAGATTIQVEVSPARSLRFEYQACTETHCLAPQAIDIYLES
ncbi:MAG: thioredoxin domain-containing protein [Fimbriimonadaceae bacterium]